MSRYHKHPFFVLEEMDQHYRKGRLQTPVQHTQDTLGIGVLIDGSHFIIKTTQVSEVLRLDKNRKISPIPTSRHWHKGLMSMRGQLVNIVDLKAYLMEKTTEIGPKTRIIMLRRGHFYTGFLVDETVGLLRADKEKTISTIRVVQTGRLAFACRQGILLDGTQWTELDLNRLYADPEFAQITNPE